jgi:hypothetical protein
MPDDHRSAMPQVTAVDDRFGTHRLIPGVLAEQLGEREGQVQVPGDVLGKAARGERGSPRCTRSNWADRPAAALDAGAGRVGDRLAPRCRRSGDMMQAAGREQARWGAQQPASRPLVSRRDYLDPPP